MIADLQRRMEMTTRIDTMQGRVDSIPFPSPDEAVVWSSQRFVREMTLPGQPPRVRISTVVHEQRFSRDGAAWRVAGPIEEHNQTARWADAEVRPWKPAGICSPLFESHAAFDPWGGDLYFVRSSPAFEGWRILVSRCTAKGWSEPKPPSFAGDGVEADPFFTLDGRSLYFISTRSLNGLKRKHLDIWRVDRGVDSIWAAPVHLPEPVNSAGAEWFPRPGPDGWLYFGSDRPGGLGATDIWRARTDTTGQWAVENLGPAVNTDSNEYEPLPSADGARLIIMGDGGLYESRKTQTGWSPRVKLGPEVNANGSEIGAVFSPSGRSLLFARDTKGPDSGEFFVWHESGSEAWPPDCTPGAGEVDKQP